MSLPPVQSQPAPLDKVIPIGFWLAGIANIGGIMLVTQGMFSDTLAQADPAVFSNFGILMIMLWGLAYIGTAAYATTSVLLPAVFALEKLAYTLNWAFWMADRGNEVAAIQSSDFLGGLFLGAYGINDGLFFLFFTAVAIINWRRAPQAGAA